jgi:hypothetical protein
MSVPLSRKVGMTLPLVGVIAFWCINAIVMGPRQYETAMPRSFLWNMLLLTVVVTSLHAAGIAWLNNRNRWDGQTYGSSIRVTIGSVLRAFLTGLAGLGAGIGLTVAIVYLYRDGQMWTHIGSALHIVVPIGIVFSLIGSIVGDLGSNLRRLAVRLERVQTSRIVGLAVAIHILWFVLMWLAVTSLEPHMPNP